MWKNFNKAMVNVAPMDAGIAGYMEFAVRSSREKSREETEEPFAYPENATPVGRNRPEPSNPWVLTQRLIRSLPMYIWKKVRPRWRAPAGDNKRQMAQAFSTNGTLR